MLLDGDVKVDSTNGIATIEFYNPKGNSLPKHLLNKLTDKIYEASEDKTIKVIVLTSEGFTVFCAGASFDELAEIKTKEEGKEFFMGFANVINAMRKSRKLIICAVQGKAVGGGVGIAAAGDYVIATKDSKIKLSELSMGIGPYVVGPAIERKVGKAVFSNLAINNEWHSAEWAREAGLFSDVYDAVEDADVIVNNLAERIAEYSMESIQQLKKVLWEGTENWDQLLRQRAELSGELVVSDFTQQFIRNFKNKRK